MRRAKISKDSTAMKSLTPILAVGVLCALSAGVANAEVWKDWKPLKEVAHRTYVRVEPGRLDDYLTALHKTWVPAEEMLQKRGVITRWAVHFRQDQVGPGPNVTLIEWYPSRAKMDPDEALFRDMTAAGQATLPKDQAKSVQAERAKYRTIVGEDDWTQIEFPK